MVGVMLGLAFGWYFPNWIESASYTIIGVASLAATPLIARYSRRWSVTTYWFGVVLLMVVCSAGLLFLYSWFGSDPIGAAVTLYLLAFLIVCLPAYLFFERVWMKRRTLTTR